MKIVRKTMTSYFKTIKADEGFRDGTKVINSLTNLRYSYENRMFSIFLFLLPFMISFIIFS